MTVMTTAESAGTPYIIVKARDMIKLMARSVPFEQACRCWMMIILAVDVIKIGNLVQNRDRFIKRGRG